MGMDSAMTEKKSRILTGDRPTGSLHLGHYLGSLKNRVAMQERYECYFIIADLHMLTTKPSREAIMGIRDNVRSIVLDYLSVGIDPEKSVIYLQSACPAVYEMNLIFEMMVSINRLTGLPSIKDMAKNAHLDPENVPFGLIGYPVLQTADILMPRAEVVPVGKDNEAHVEIARDIARRFNQYYGEVFPLPEPFLSETPTLIGTDGKGKMSKSAGNAINLSDDLKTVEKKYAECTRTLKGSTHIFPEQSKEILSSFTTICLIRIKTKLRNSNVATEKGRSAMSKSNNDLPKRSINT